jgi:prepilin-type processing-associated H-X9-DG protein
LQPSFLKQEVCAATSKTILMFEQTLNPSQGYGLTGGFNTAGQYTAEDARAEGERHKRDRGGVGGNVLYLDGHVDWRNDLWDRTLTNPQIPKRGDLTWFPYYY